MRNTLLVLLACGPLFGSGQINGKTVADSLINEVKESDFDVYRTLGKVPKSFFRFINRNGWDLTMVDYGKDFNKTDIGSNHLPNSMLIELGISKKGLYVLLFDHGGYGVARRAFIFRRVRKKFIIKELLLRPSVESIEILKQTL